MPYKEVTDLPESVREHLPKRTPLAARQTEIGALCALETASSAARDDRHSAYWLGKVTGYVVWIGILTGKVFRVGDRVMMGGVRGDMIDVSPLRTTIMEVGSPGSEEGSDVWVRGRQYTGRVVTVSNKAFFDEPIYNYSKDFDYIWDPVGPLEVNLPSSLAVRVQRRAGVPEKIPARDPPGCTPTGSPAPLEEPG